MSVEQHSPSTEHQAEVGRELETLAQQNLEARETINPEQAAEHQQERAEAARETIQRHETAPEPPATPAEAAPKPSFIARLDHHLNYTQTLQSLQRQLTPVGRNFSQIIHTPVVEKTSEVLEKTVMRPSVVAGATWTALLVGLIFYFTARRYGFELSGSEMLLALVLGGFLGLALEGFLYRLRRR